MIAMAMTVRAKNLPPEEIQNFALHLTRMPMPPQNILDALPVDYNTLIVLWLVQSGAKVENCMLATEIPETEKGGKFKRKEAILEECLEEMNYEPYGRRDLNKSSQDDYDHLKFDTKEGEDKSPEFLKDVNEENFKFSSNEGQVHLKLDSEDSGFPKSEDASTLGVGTTLSSNEVGSRLFSFLSLHCRTVITLCLLCSETNIALYITIEAKVYNKFLNYYMIFC